jgi:Protein of unknown function DUF2834
MSRIIFQLAIILAAVAFTGYFCMTVIPGLIENPDLPAALAAGYVNPFASAYTMDALACWFILLFWVVYEAITLDIKHGWVCPLLGLFPGVAVGFALYLLLREKQISRGAA